MNINPFLLTRALSLFVAVVVVIALRDFMRVAWEIAAPLWFLLVVETALYVFAVVVQSEEGHHDD